MLTGNPPRDWSLMTGPIHLIKYRGKAKGCLKRIERTDREKSVSKNRSLLEVCLKEIEERGRDNE